MLSQDNQDSSLDDSSQYNQISDKLTGSRGGKRFSAASASAVNVLEKMTPCSNTGSKSQANNNSSLSVPSKGFGNWEVWQPSYEPWIDYLQGTGFCNWSELVSLMDLFRQQSSDRFVPKLGSGYYVGNRRYAHSHSSLLGIIINWERRDFNADIDINENAEIDICNEISALTSDTEIRFHISIPGKPLNAIGAKNGINLCRLLSDAYSFSCSRIDCKVRNHSWVVDFDKLRIAVENKDIVGSFQTTSIKSEDLRRVSTGLSSRDENLTQKSGETRVFGSPKSDKRISFYDARPVHNVDAIDIEVRFRKKLAKSAFKQVLGDSGQIFTVYESLRAIQNIVAGSIDFIHKIPGERNINRCERYAFWQEFRDAVGGAIRVSRPRKVVDVVKQKQWLETKVFRVLGMTKELMGSTYFHKWMDDLCKRGKLAMNNTQEAYIQMYRDLGLHRVKFVPYRNDGISAISLD